MSKLPFNIKWLALPIVFGAVFCFPISTSAQTKAWSWDPVLTVEEAWDIAQNSGEYGSEALKEYEGRYGKLTEEQRDQFLAEQDEYEKMEADEWLSDLYAQDPNLFVEPVGGLGSKLEIVVNKAKQRMNVRLNGKTVTGLENIKISTGKTGGSETPVGKFQLKGKEIVKRRINRTFTQKLKRPVYLEDAVQVQGGIFLHKASSGAQNKLGQKASAGCVRIDRSISAKVFNLAQKHRANGVVIIQ